MRCDVMALRLNRSPRQTPMSLPGQALDGIYSVLRKGRSVPPRIYTLCGSPSRFGFFKFASKRSRNLEAKMPVYHAYIVGTHSRFIGAVQMDCADDDTAIKSASRLVERHDVELWQKDRPVVRFDAASKQMFKKSA
jgi:hypothetical protein